MKFLYFVILILGFVSGTLCYYDHHDTSLSLHDDYYPDDYIEEPCPVYDLDCIRKYFSKRTGCTPAHGPPYDPILKTMEFDIPHSNISMQLNNALYKGFSKARVETFYINKRTHTLVFEVVFDRLQVDSLKTVVTYYRKGREPLESSDYTSVIFYDLSLTLTVKNFDELHSIDSNVYAYVADPHPPLIVGPGLKKEIKGHTATTEWKYFLGLSAQEGMIRQAPIYMNMFLYMNICDFKSHHM